MRPFCGPTRCEDTRIDVVGGSTRESFKVGVVIHIMKVSHKIYMESQPGMQWKCVKKHL